MTNLVLTGGSRTPVRQGRPVRRGHAPEPMSLHHPLETLPDPASPLSNNTYPLGFRWRVDSRRRCDVHELTGHEMPGRQLRPDGQHRVLRHPELLDLIFRLDPRFREMAELGPRRAFSRTVGGPELEGVEVRGVRRRRGMADDLTGVDLRVRGISLFGATERGKENRPGGR